MANQSCSSRGCPDKVHIVRNTHEHVTKLILDDEGWLRTLTGVRVAHQRNVAAASDDDPRVGRHAGRPQATLDALLHGGSGQGDS